MVHGSLKLPFSNSMVYSFGRKALSVRLSSLTMVLFDNIDAIGSSCLVRVISRLSRPRR